jgi:hypothetical protein
MGNVAAHAKSSVADNGFQFVTLFGVAQAILIVLFGIFVEYGDTVGSLETDTAAPMEEVYPMFQDVHVMIFVGFGLLMTFLRKYMYGAIGFTFMIATFCIQWSLLNVSFWDQVIANKFHYIGLDINKYGSCMLSLVPPVMYVCALQVCARRLCSGSSADQLWCCSWTHHTNTAACDGHV